MPTNERDAVAGSGGDAEVRPGMSETGRARLAEFVESVQRFETAVWNGEAEPPRVSGQSEPTFCAHAGNETIERMST